MKTPAIPRHVEAIRRFNRFYTRQIGLLQEGLLSSPFSLSEARVIYELAHREETTATQLADELGLDLGYLSRIVSGLQERGLVEKRTSSEDRRHQLITLTYEGEVAFARLNAASRRQIEEMLGDFNPADRDRLLSAMSDIQELMGAPQERQEPYILRPHQPGDMGWVVQRHGVLYNREYGWNQDFEALVAGIVSHFIQSFDREMERCWIAEREGENVGSVLLVRHPDREGVARLRLLLVEPSARGLGIGRRLVQECTRFARQVGYGKIALWTNSVLDAARTIYETEGYRLVREREHRSFGADLVGQDWELDL